MSFSSSPVFIVPNIGKSSENFLDLFERFNLYGEEFLNINDSFEKLRIFVGIKQNDFNLCVEKEFSFLEVHRISDPTENFILFGLKSFLKIKALKFHPSILVASNLYLGFLSCFLVKMVAPWRWGIQVSVHGSTLNSSDGFFLKLIRELYLKFVFSQSKSVRTVSEHLSEQLIKVYKLNPSRIFVAPIPIDIPQKMVSKKETKVIAFIGRMHYERGVAEWSEIISMLHQKRDDFEVFLIGDGPQSKQLKSRLANKSPHLVVTDFGYLSREKLQEQWCKIHIFLSSAPMEGYGLTLREAVLTETFVCARKSEGSVQVANRVPEAVATYSSNFEAIGILDSQLDRVFPTLLALDYEREIRKQNLANIHLLVNSWV